MGPGVVATPRDVQHAAGVLVRAGRIVRVGPFSELRAASPAATPYLDARGGLVLPGLINSHTHFYSTLACGIPLASPPGDFLATLERLWWRLDRALAPEDVALSARVAAAECVAHGVTTVIDHHASPNACAGSLELLREAVAESGIRAALCYEVSDRDGPQRAAEGIAENVRFLRAQREQPTQHIAAMFGLHALFTLSPRTLARSLAAARQAGAWIHLHVSEDRVDVERTRAVHGATPVKCLAREQVLGDRALLAHCVQVSDEEIALLAESRAFVVHNPESNMNNAVGLAPVAALLARGVRVGLGTDGMGADLLAAARAAYLLQRHAGREPGRGVAQAAAMLWIHNATLASALFGQSLGSLEPGAAADLIVLDYAARTPLDTQNLFAHLLCGFSTRDVVATVVAGRVLMRERELLGIDRRELLVRAREHARTLWERF